MEEPRAISLHLPCAFRYLCLVRDAALEFCRSLGMAGFQSYQVEMAVDEACAQVIEFSYGGECPPEREAEDPGFTVRFSEIPGGLQIEIVDRGAGFDPVAQSDAGLKADKVNEDLRAMGMYVLRQFVDEVNYERAARDGNRLLLTKWLRS